MKQIRSKLWLGMMILVGTVMLLLWLFQIIFLDKFYSVLVVDHTIKKAEHLAQEIGELGSIDEIEASSLNNELQQFIYEKQLTMEIIDGSDQVIYQAAFGNGPMMPGMWKDAAVQVLQAAREGKIRKQQLTHPKFGFQYLLAGIPINSSGEAMGVMLITMPLASMEDTADILKQQLIIITGILLVISLLLSFVLSKRFANPILKISRQAEAFTAGQLSVRIEDAGKDEIGQLAVRMNKMGDQLMQNDMLQKELIANVSHELRTPLSLIRGYAETLRDVTGDQPEKRKKQLEIIVDESERLSDIVEDILQLSQLQAGASVLMKEAFSINELLLKIREQYLQQGGSHSYQIIGAEELQENALGDKTKIEQVLRNLIDNAFHHSNSENPVEVIVTQSRDRFKIEVRDRGEGIAEEELTHVFERYYRGKTADEIKSKGTGLGLAIVKSILELHQMPYGVTSQLGKGTTFWFQLEKEKWSSS